MIYKNISLKNYNTFGLDYKASTLIKIKTEEDAISVLHESKSLKRPLLILGGGSNILFTADFDGIIIHSGIGGIRVEEKTPEYVIVSAGSGINWDEFVEWSVSNGNSGIENLSLIPGLTGASPIQNIGAYGVEVKDVIEKVRAVSIDDCSIREFSNRECQFGYRNSIFKQEYKGKFLVTRVFFRLRTSPEYRLNYGSLNAEISKLGELCLRNVRQAVINIRRSKLPDPQITGNAGSFFKNPVIASTYADILQEKYPLMPFYPEATGKTKIAAGWLIEQCGWKGKKSGSAAVHENQALVLINTGNASGKDIYDLSEKIKQSVYEKFNVELDREVEIVGPI